MTRKSRQLVFILFGNTLLALGLARCGDSGDTGGDGTAASVTITAPTAVSPNSTISDSQPTLTVTNATVSNGATPTYSFQVASDQGFTSIIAQATGIAQGSGQTSWRVSQPLGDGAYFWRARAEVSGTVGPYSSAAQFAVSRSTAGPGETTVVFDPLTGGSSLASERGGGTFTADGWRVNANEDFLRYEIPTVANGYVQWQNVGLTPEGANGNSHMLFGMWDPRAGNYRQNAFRVHLQKLWGPTHNPPYIRLRWISQGRQEDDGFNFTNWNAGTVYTWRIDWGRNGDTIAQVLLDGVEIMEVNYSRPYQPHTQWVELGVDERDESVIGAVYRNFLVVRR
jgi:hypothetical protein